MVVSWLVNESGSKAKLYFNALKSVQDTSLTRLKAALRK